MSGDLNERIYRVIDANLNRLKEGLRVVEDIRRYVFDDLALSSQIKTLRHKAKIDSSEFIKFRDATNDVLKPSIKSEFDRANLTDLQIANLKRAQESARVLEECFKLIDTTNSEIFKSIRYDLYEIEKEI
ncbi:thiamine-phosphate pyrophosphorylase [Campylobacter sp. RM16187]|uniref:thiamine-phosphate pyrophosphorylase n=1 Tax=Campylobacter sp. RM16187 TaxID=1660063 RepID=UPI0021B4EA8B|nr:thiamine-phosphate pyrophosphorylase [Campylobacter sp. RM16187]QKG30202.1 thiamine phosphate synthase [Campylobacter sp. RM16187]